MPKEMELGGKEGSLERTHIERRRSVYQEIIIFSSLRLFCSVGSTKNQRKDLSRALLCSIPPRFMVAAKNCDYNFVHCTTVKELCFSSLSTLEECCS